MLRRILQRTPGRVGSQGSDLDSSAAPINTVDVNNESSSEGFICPLCMKRCITPIDLSEHYQKVHAENETRGQELLNNASVTVGPVYFVLAAWLWVA